MTFTNQNTNTPSGGGGFIKFSQGAVLTPSGGTITPTDTHHHVAAGTISTIATTNLDTNVQQFLLLTADGAVTITTGATIVARTVSLASGDSVLYMLDGGTTWRELTVIPAGGGAGGTQTANRVFAGPTSGGAAAPTFRALVAADIPSTVMTTDTVQTATAAKTFSSDVTASLGVYERGRAARMGEWTTPTYNSADFTATAGTWTVDSVDITTYSYRVIGKSITVAFVIDSTDVSATPVALKIKIPGGYTAAKRTENVIWCSDAGAAYATGLVQAVAGDTSLYIYRNPGGTSWTTTAADNTSVHGQIEFEIQ